MGGGLRGEGLGFCGEGKKGVFAQALQEQFTPEFLGRLDATVYFEPLGENAMEAIARQTPLSRQHRPQWDLNVLGSYGIQASADENIWRRVWTKEERINNASTPMFLVEGRKPGLLEN